MAHLITRGFLQIKYCLLAVSLMAAAQSWAELKQEKVAMETDFGTIVIALYPEKAPATAQNFLDYVDSHYYDGTVFHRVVPNFVVQGGGFRFDYTKKETRDPVVNESDNGLRNAKGTIAMARTPHPDSATSQFYFNLRNNFSLDPRNGNPGYTVFGEVIEGFSVLEEIARQPQGKNRRFPNAPDTAIRIIKAERIKVKAAKAEENSTKEPVAEQTNSNTDES